jgi:hypothetical protein
MPDTDYIRQQLAVYPQSRWGFVIYRLTYEDDAQWKRFLDHLVKRTRLRLEENKDRDLFERIAWTVHESPHLCDASDRQVRR